MFKCFRARPELAEGCDRDHIYVTCVSFGWPDTFILLVNVQLCHHTNQVLKTQISREFGMVNVLGYLIFPGTVTFIFIISYSFGPTLYLPCVWLYHRHYHFSYECCTYTYTVDTTTPTSVRFPDGLRCKSYYTFTYRYVTDSVLAHLCSILGIAQY
jgi:hypothetical protein